MVWVVNLNGCVEPLINEYCIAEDIGGKNILSTTPLSLLHNTNVVANGLNFNFGGILIWCFF